MIGLTLRGKALTRWFLSRPVTAQYALQYEKNVVPQGKKGSTYHRSGKAAVKRWDEDVAKLSDMFQSGYINPFDLTKPPSQLVSIATGATVTKTIEESMTNALDKSSTMLNTFVSDQLIGNENGERKSVFAAMSRSNLKTMTDMKNLSKL